MHFEPLIQLTRGGVPESLHYGAVAVADARGTLLAQVGDAQQRIFTRSTLKALQALPFVEADGIARMGLGQDEVALLCASHNGEARHVAAAESMLHKAGLTRMQLRCGCHVPGLFTLLEQAPPADLQFDERHNNCSGKHAGFLAHCVQQGWPTDDYTDPAHPLQQAVRHAVARAVGMDADTMAMGIDGCSAPNYAMPLWRLAYGYARLASGARDAEFGPSFAALSEAMTAQAWMVSGSGRNDLALTEAGRGDWVCKIGADGVQVIGSKRRQQALAIKVSDGSKPALFAATVEVLEQLGWLDDAQRTLLEPWRGRTLRNARGLAVGERRPVFQLQRLHPLA